MSRNPHLRRGFEPTAEELRSGTGCELVAQRARYAFEQGDYPTAFHLLWEAIASAAVLNVVPPDESARVTDSAVRLQCLKQLRAWRTLRETQGRTLRAFHAVRDYLVDGTPPANRRAQEAITDEAELHRLYHEVCEIFQQLLVEMPE